MNGNVFELLKIITIKKKINAIQIEQHVFCFKPLYTAEPFMSSIHYAIWILFVKVYCGSV